MGCSASGSSVNGILQARKPSGLPCSPPGDLLYPHLCHLLHWQAGSLPLLHLGSKGAACVRLQSQWPSALWEISGEKVNAKGNRRSQPQEGFMVFLQYLSVLPAASLALLPVDVSKCEVRLISYHSPTLSSSGRGLHQSVSHTRRPRPREAALSAAGECAALRLLSYSAGGSFCLISGSKLAEFLDDANPILSPQELEEMTST